MGNDNCCFSRGKQKKETQIIETQNCVLIIGQPGSGKSKLHQKLLKMNQNKFCFVDCLAIDLEESIDKREAFINYFQNEYSQITKRKQKQIISLIVTVKFERTDIMKRNLLSVIKYFQLFIDLIIIAVTHFDLSDNQQQDEDHLRNSLKFLLKNDQSRIVFSGNSDIYDNQINQTLSTIIQKIEDGNKNKLAFTLQNTIFEKLDETTQLNQLEDFSQYPKQQLQSKKF
ncbi:unnamed protein product [Paramecium sonneborni]|uniref:Uncharacterized protein n=1 Tax=Paramecium sonneborni TaxID=65129 RepID=A0A8S1MWC5_9CILI|nr:unnamed protein product [Paramecium sonneborni]